MDIGLNHEQVALNMDTGEYIPLMQNKQHYLNSNLLFEYTQILSRQKAKFGQNYFNRQEQVNENMAYDVFRMAIEVFLHWTPEQALARLDKRIIAKMRLDLVMNYMKLPFECEFNDDYTWILHKLYPDKIRYDQEEHVIRIYHQILNGNKYKWPKWYFSDADGHERAYICLRYMISHNMHYDTPQDLYEQFITGDGQALINRLGLKTVAKDEFEDPITYLYKAMFEDTGDEFTYHFYKVKYYYMQAQKHEERFNKEERLAIRSSS